MRAVSLNVFDTFFLKCGPKDGNIVVGNGLADVEFYTSTSNIDFHNSVAGQYCRLAKLRYDRGAFHMNTGVANYIRRLKIIVHPLEHCAVAADACEVFVDKNIGHTQYSTMMSAVMFCNMNGYAITMASAISDCVATSHVEIMYSFVPQGKDRLLENVIMAVLVTSGVIRVFLGDNAGQAAVDSLVGRVVC